MFAHYARGIAGFTTPSRNGHANVTVGNVVRAMTEHHRPARCPRPSTWSWSVPAWPASPRPVWCRTPADRWWCSRRPTVSVAVCAPISSDGFRLDRGFQVLLTAYPEVATQLDLPALQMRPFLPGSLVWTGERPYAIGDPMRRPSLLLPSAVAPIGSLRDKLRLAALLRRVKVGRPPRPAARARHHHARVAPGAGFQCSHHRALLPSVARRHPARPRTVGQRPHGRGRAALPRHRRLGRTGDGHAGHSRPARRPPARRHRAPGHRGGFGVAGRGAHWPTVAPSSPQRVVVATEGPVAARLLAQHAGRATRVRGRWAACGSTRRRRPSPSRSSCSTACGPARP